MISPMSYFDINLAQKCVECCKIRYRQGLGRRSGRVGSSLHRENSTDALFVGGGCAIWLPISCLVGPGRVGGQARHKIVHSKKSVTRFLVFDMVMRFSVFGIRSSGLGTGVLRIRYSVCIHS